MVANGLPNKVYRILFERIARPELKPLLFQKMLEFLMAIKQALAVQKKFTKQHTTERKCNWMIRRPWQETARKVTVGLIQHEISDIEPCTSRPQIPKCPGSQRDEQAHSSQHHNTLNTAHASSCYPCHQFRMGSYYFRGSHLLFVQKRIWRGHFLRYSPSWRDLSDPSLRCSEGASESLSAYGNTWQGYVVAAFCFFKRVMVCHSPDCALFSEVTARRDKILF